MDPGHQQQRRAFLTGGLVGAATGLIGAAAVSASNRQGAVAGAGPAIHTGDRVRWRLASSFPSSLETMFGGAEVLAQRVAAMTGGKFEITPYQAGEIVPGLQVLDAVQKGSVEVGQSAGYYYTGKHPALAFDTCVPFGLTPRQQAAWLHEAGGLTLMRSIYAQFGIRNFPGGNTGAQMGGWFKGRVDRLDDLRGLKMRIPGLGGKVMDALGVTVQVLAGGEIYTALERGALDATEWVGPADDEQLGFYKVAKNYYYPGWWEPGPSLAYLVGQPAWDSLSAEYRAVFQTACSEASQVMQARYDNSNPAALQRLLARGVNLLPFSDEIMAASKEASEQLLIDQAAANKEYSKILDHWRTFREDSFRWFGTAELAYAKYAWS